MPVRLMPKVGEYRQDIIEHDGLRWIIGKGSEDFLTVNHEMEPPGRSVHDYLCRQFAPGVTFLDIGAHAGHYTIRAARAGCTVYAVEANPETAAMLRLNLQINNLTASLWAVAAWDQHAILGFTQPAGPVPLRNGSASVASPARYTQPAGITVAAVPLDDLLASLDRLDVVKMDVEGSDIHVIDGMAASLARLRPLLIFESHLFYGTYTAQDMAEREARLTAAAGYRWQDITELGTELPAGDCFRIGTPG